MPPRNRSVLPEINSSGQAVPFTPRSKPATQEDVEAGRAVFCVPDDRSKIYDLGISLPVRAKTRNNIGSEGENPIPAGTIIEVVQCEIVDGSDILVGFRQGSEEGVCSLEEIEILAARA